MRPTEWGWMGQNEKTRNIPVLPPALSLSAGFSSDGSRGRGGGMGERQKAGRGRSEAREVLWLLLGLSLTKGQRRIPILL